MLAILMSIRSMTASLRLPVRRLVVGKAAQLLLYLLCIAPIALFPVGLAYKIYTHFFP